VIKLAMIDLHHELAARKTGARLLLQVHDELVLEAPESTAHDTAQLVVDVMEHAYKRFGLTLLVPLKANAQWGYNWLDLKVV
jgi:DNA polymerase-1